MKKATIFMLLASIFLLAGCISQVAVGPVQTDSQSVELGDADSVRVEVKMGIGELEITGGAANLMDAEFTYNIEDWRPEVSYDQRGDIGELQISQPDGEINGIPDNDIKYSWEIALQNDVPMDLEVDLGVGESVLTLGGLHLQNLVVDTGVGQATIDLTGSWQGDVDVQIDGGIGEATIYLPENVGLRVEASTGIGSLVINGLQKEEDSDVYTNESYGNAAVNMTLDISGGIGEISVQVGR
ncbi:MAG: lipoprotein [Ardenticatenaceae bacterium]|nr:MAG: lipoprotein [Ardenticatenaceae bacterium]